MYFRKREKGFSLIEVLIATVILCAIIPLTSYFINSMKTNNKTELQQTANYVAQKYMEEYKAKNLATFTTENYTEVDPDTGLYAHIKVELDPVYDPSVGSMSITGLLGAGINIVMGSETYSGANDGATLVLKIIDDGTAEKLQLEDEGGMILKSIDLQTVTPICADRIISFTIEGDDPQITINTKNELPSSRWVILNVIENNVCPNVDLNIEGKVGTTTNAVSTERGATVTITVKDKTNSEELVKVAQARKI